MASSGRLNGSQIKLEIIRAFPDGGMRRSRGLHPSSVFEWIAITNRWEPVMESLKAPKRSSVSVTNQPLAFNFVENVEKARPSWSG